MRTPQNDAQTPARQQLINCLEQQEQQFAAATKLIADLQAAGESGVQGRLGQLQKQMAAIRTTGAAVQQATAQWEAAGQPRDAELSAALKQQEERLLTFLNTVEGLTSDFRTRKLRMEPQLDNDATRRSMHSAYQRSLRTG